MRQFANVLMVIIAVSCTSCGETRLQYKDGDTIYFPDTAQFLSEWNMKEKIFLSDAFIADSPYSWLPLDTFTLTYHLCDCPDWEEDVKEIDSCPSCNDYYLEESDTLLRFPSRFYVSGNTVKIYGRRLNGRFLPRDREFTVPNPPKWNLIRYYGYEVIRPYDIWGPNMKELQEPGDTLIHTVRLTIRN